MTKRNQSTTLRSLLRRGRLAIAARHRSVMIILVVCLFGSIGVVMVFISSAAPFQASFEAESGANSATAVKISDSAASNTSAIKFTNTPVTSCPQNTPNTPDGPDPWNGCWPGPQTTGIAGCPALTTHNGDLNIGSNTTVENKLINGQLRIGASGATNITIRCVKVMSGTFFPVDTERDNATSPTHILLERVEVDCGGSPTTHAGLLLYGITVRKLNVHNCMDGLRYGGNVVLEDSYCHDLYAQGDEAQENHYDCSQTGGGENFTIRHNSLVGRDTSDIALWPEVWNGTVVPIKNILVERNLLIGTPGYKLYIGKDHANVPGNAGSATNITVRENRFGGGGYGPCSVTNANPTWTNNVWNDTGATIPLSNC